ncbi:MAG: mannitol dehydrogenase family protein, partial [Mesorhizobium sp.]
DYTAQLAKRYSNTALAHRTAQIANDGSQKLPQRIVAAAMERMSAGAPPAHLMLVVAAWIAACEARGEALPESHFTDPLDLALAALDTRHLSAGETVAAVFDLAGFAKGGAERLTLIDLAGAHLERLRQGGVAAAFTALGIQGAKT